MQKMIDLEINLRLLQVEDVEQSYVDWYKSDGVSKYSESQYRSFTIEGQRSYVRSCLQNDDLDLYGIFLKKKHIGNIVISGFLSVHRNAKITYVIGDEDYWGKGIASFVVSLIVGKARTEYGLHKLYAACAEKNIGSRKVLERNGFQLEGRRKEHLVFRTERLDQLDFGLIL